MTSTIHKNTDLYESIRVVYECYARKNTEKVIVILKRVKLTYLIESVVRNTFKKCYSYLVSQERYEECATLRKIEKRYNKELKSQKK